MMKLVQSSLALLLITGIAGLSSCKPEVNPENRQITILDSDWQFINEDIADAASPSLKVDTWETVEVPHDWAISGEFNIDNDALEIQILEDGDMRKKLRTGLTGGLPHVGIGWYRKTINLSEADKGKRIHLEFDGVMSNAKVYVNGTYIGQWPYGYSSFGFDVTEHLQFGEPNIVAVRAENRPQSARWYPGAGIYREVRMVATNPIYVKQWGTYITTPKISDDQAIVNIQTTALNKSGANQNVTIETRILSPENVEVAKTRSSVVIDLETKIDQQIEVSKPQLWDINSPNTYTAITRIIQDNQVLDEYTTTFGIRSFEFTYNDGFFLNGNQTEIKGVCLHHDLGPLGAAVNESSLRHRLTLLKEMGANAIRSTHNPPTPKMLKLADEMGFLVIDEAFDEWKEAKVPNGYNQLWDEWAEKDLVAMIHRDRNHPSVIMWSIGNEVREQKMKDGALNAIFLSDICHREDPTRPTTAGFNNRQASIDNGLAAAVDMVGWNYEPNNYVKAHDQYPQFKVIGSETASTVDSRGIYHFPAAPKNNFDKKAPYHLSAYALNFPSWGNIPDLEFKAQDDNEFMPGEFVWTGFDYLGEPTPFYEEWPSRSSYFGIIDLSGIPKDRYYLYQSKWSDKEVLHLLPHWNWSAGDTIPVHCFTSFERAELFLNGKSLGIREKNPNELLTTYRLIWDAVIFEPGELKVVALDANDQPLKETIMKTAGKPFGLVLSPDKTTVTADGKEMVFVTVSVVDEQGTVCPNATNLIEFSTEGSGTVHAVGNGDQTSLESFVQPFRKAFSGKCMAIIKSSKAAGQITLTAKSEGLITQQLTINARAL
ncbi:MAG: beta-galactosidase [Marinoscillum sp.]|jgi:beta-galactosidase